MPGATRTPANVQQKLRRAEQAPWSRAICLPAARGWVFDDYRASLSSPQLRSDAAIVFRDLRFGQLASTVCNASSVRLSHHFPAYRVLNLRRYKRRTRADIFMLRKPIASRCESRRCRTARTSPTTTRRAPIQRAQAGGGPWPIARFIAFISIGVWPASPIVRWLRRPGALTLAHLCRCEPPRRFRAIHKVCAALGTWSNARFRSSCARPVGLRPRLRAAR